LVLGILGLVCFGLFTGIPAVICGHQAQSRIRRSGGVLMGEGMALAGLITGYISIALSIILLPLMLAIAIPNFIKAREVAQRNGCINNLRMLDAAKHSWALEQRQPDDALPTTADLDPYLKTPIERLRCPAGGEYTLNPVEEPPSCSVPGHELLD
jgi:competence protein ComGC